MIFLKGMETIEWEGETRKLIRLRVVFVELRFIGKEVMDDYDNQSMVSFEDYIEKKPFCLSK